MKRDVVLTLEYKKPHLFWKIILWFFLCILTSFIVLFVYAQFKINKFLTTFAQNAELEKQALATQGSTFLNQVKTSYDQKDQAKTKYLFLILGTDKLSGRENDPELSDSMVLLKVDLKTHTVDTLSLPRDLYSEAYQTKINALYFYGQEQTPDDPKAFPTKVISEATGLTIDKTLVIGIEDLEHLISLVEPLTITVPTAFTDTAFPIPGVDVATVRDPRLLYETVSFTAGTQTMDASTALKYMRSRHSESDEGTDESRAMRQQLVLAALVQRILETRDPETLGKLYRFYIDNFADDLSLQELATMSGTYLYHLEQQQKSDFDFTFEKHHLSIYPDDQSGVIYHPPLWQTQQQWIYQIRDQESFRKYLHEIFN